MIYYLGIDLDLYDSKSGTVRSYSLLKLGELIKKSAVASLQATGMFQTEDNRINAFTSES
jgi:hypothetical protein